MSTIPAANAREIRELVRAGLPSEARPDFRPQNRWYVATIDEEYQQQVESVCAALEDRGYEVSVLGQDVKVTKAEVDWPDASE